MMARQSERRGKRRLQRRRQASASTAICKGGLASRTGAMPVSYTHLQELIANMLGVRREGVTDAAGKLQKLGVIQYLSLIHI